MIICYSESIGDLLCLPERNPSVSSPSSLVKERGNKCVGKYACVCVRKKRETERREREDRQGCLFWNNRENAGWGAMHARMRRACTSIRPSVRPFTRCPREHRTHFCHIVIIQRESEKEEIRRSLFVFCSFFLPRSFAADERDEKKDRMREKDRERERGEHSSGGHTILRLNSTDTAAAWSCSKT